MKYFRDLSVGSPRSITDIDTGLVRKLIAHQATSVFFRCRYFLPGEP
jgi:hypothetical protein